MNFLREQLHLTIIEELRNNKSELFKRVNAIQKIKNHASPSYIWAIKSLLIYISKAADTAYGGHKKSWQKPSVLGTYKHSFCEAYILEIQRDKHGYLENVATEVEFPRKAKVKRLDVYVRDIGFVFDYKFGDDNKGTTTTTEADWKEVLKANGELYRGYMDIRPNDSDT